MTIADASQALSSASPCISPSFSRLSPSLARFLRTSSGSLHLGSLDLAPKVGPALCEPLRASDSSTKPWKPAKGDCPEPGNLEARVYNVTLPSQASLATSSVHAGTCRGLADGELMSWYNMSSIMCEYRYFITHETPDHP